MLCDKAIRKTVLARIIEPTSKQDSLARDEVRDLAGFKGHVTMAWPGVIAAYLRATLGRARQPKTS
jgi:hypothetical protein